MQQLKKASLWANCWPSSSKLNLTERFLLGLDLRPGSVGKPYTGVYSKILNPDPGTGVGEVVGRSRNIFMGYHNHEEKTKEAFTDGNI